MRLASAVSPSTKAAPVESGSAGAMVAAQHAQGRGAAKSKQRRQREPQQQHEAITTPRIPGISRGRGSATV
jgi:hypothetical protein